MQMLRMLWPSCCPPNWDPCTMLSNIWTRQIVAIPLPLCPGIRGFWCWESSLGSKRILQDFLWDWCGSETVKWANVNEQDWPVISNMFQLKAPNLRTRTRLQVGDVVSWQVSVLTWACPCINVTIWPGCTAGSTVPREVCRWSSPSSAFCKGRVRSQKCPGRVWSCCGWVLQWLPDSAEFGNCNDVETWVRWACWALWVIKMSSLEGHNRFGQKWLCILTKDYAAVFMQAAWEEYFADWDDSAFTGKRRRRCSGAITKTLVLLSSKGAQIVGCRWFKII